MNSLSRSALLPLESLTHGPVYGLARYRIRSPRSLDPEQNWNFWTRPRNPLVMRAANGYPPAFVRKLLVKLRFLLKHETGIAAHYDVSNEFYELFLDKKYMFYSCADFDRGDETLEEAQENKANYILNLIDPRKGERILELGCGWGAMLRRIYEATGDRENLYGYTLSRKQVEYLREHYGFNVSYRNFITTSYEPGSFDKIYSIGAWEHVRPGEIPVLLKKLFEALRPGGKLIQHFFCLPNHDFPSSQVLGQIFFPGSVLAPYSYQIESCRRAGFRVTHESEHDYRKTLRAWYDNLVAGKERAIELTGVANYNKYLVFFPVAWKMFDEGQAGVHRLVLEKP
ncbi:MAG TPA: class I SAM-dependent methyltransferase [Pyrinomonadaceae bacterium]|jgi:cyclopropane-fatty-acyl-phospholipid synthase|nr:class I SAM-dependent methyltransferase [Pyrinomonadaceae bacterium]